MGAGKIRKSQFTPTFYAIGKKIFCLSYRDMVEISGQPLSNAFHPSDMTQYIIIIYPG